MSSENNFELNEVDELKACFLEMVLIDTIAVKIGLKQISPREVKDLCVSNGVQGGYV